MSLTAKSLGFAALCAVGLSLSAGSASAGTVNIDCYCTPDTVVSDAEPNLLYCLCEKGQTLSALATNEYRRRCRTEGALIASALPEINNQTMISDRPKGVTCTGATTLGPMTPDYVFNQCTNWTWMKKSLTVQSYCVFDNR